MPRWMTSFGSLSPSQRFGDLKKGATFVLQGQTFLVIKDMGSFQKMLGDPDDPYSGKYIGAMDQEGNITVHRLGKHEFRPVGKPIARGVLAGLGDDVDWPRVERSLKMRGVADADGVSVKIVQHGSGDGFSVETTVGGDRRYPTEAPMTLPEAQVFALQQLRNPRAARPAAVEPPAVTMAKVKAARPYVNVAELAAHYKAKGMTRHLAWDQYIKDVILQPRVRSEEVDAKEFFKAFDRAPSSLHPNLSGLDRPSKSWTDAFVKTAALNTVAARGGAPMKAQQRYHAAYMKKLVDGQAKWPGIDFTSGLDAAVERYLSAHPHRGPGQDW